MKESITNFDLEAAFKALDEIEIPKAKKGIKANKPALTEIFSRKSKFDSLFEEYYDVGNTAELSDAKEAREAEIAKAKLARIEKIVDLDAESPEDLLTSYVGKYIIQCPQCMTLFYKNPEDVEESEDDATTVNVNEACQHCGNESGYTLIGKVGEATPEEETTTEETELDYTELETENTTDGVVSDEGAADEETADNAEGELEELNIDDELEEIDLEIEDDEETETKEEAFSISGETQLLEELTESSELDISADEFEQLINSSEFKKPISDRAARAMMQEFDEGVSAEKTEANLLDAFNSCKYDVIDAGYTNSNNIIVTLNHYVQDVELAANDIIGCLGKAGINNILDWNTNGNNVFIFSTQNQNALTEAAEEIEEYKLVFEPTTDAKDKDLTNKLCDTVSKIGIKYYGVKKVAGKYHINILGSADDLHAAKIIIENSGFFKAWLNNDKLLASGYDSESAQNSLKEGVFDKLKDKFANSLDKIISTLKSREAKADWILKNAMENYDDVQISSNDELSPNENSRKFDTFIVICFKNRYSNGKLIADAPSFTSKNLVVSKKAEFKKNYKDADDIAKGWSIKSGSGPAFIYLAKSTEEHKAVFLCEYFKGNLEYDQLEKYFEIVKKDIKGSKFMSRGGASQEKTADQNINDMAKEATAANVTPGMKIKVGPEVGEIIEIGKSKRKAGNIAIKIKLGNGNIEIISVDPEAALTLVEALEEPTQQNLNAVMENIDELNESALETLISDYLVETYKSAAGYKLTECRYVDKQLILEGKILLTSGYIKKVSYNFTEALVNNTNKICLYGSSLNTDFTLTGVTDDNNKTFIAESFYHNKKK